MQARDVPVRYALDLDEILDIETLLSGRPAEDPGGPDFCLRSRELADRLPGGLRGFLRDFRAAEPAAAALVTGLPVDDDALGPTPLHWRDEPARGRREELYLATLATALGEPFTWSTLQRGRIVQNVLPIPGEENAQSGHGQVLLEWHTEDAFHPCRCDYLLLFGARNRDRVATTLSSVREVRLDPAHRKVLSDARFHILPDDEHLQQFAMLDPDDAGLLRMRRMRDDPEPVAVLFGASGDPCLRIDPFFMRPLPGDTEAGIALDALVAELNRVQQRVVVEQGTVLIVDNHRAVHGREPFKARFDGTDRWLKKIVVTRDLHRSRALRRSARSRVIG